MSIKLLSSYSPMSYFLALYSIFFLSFILFLFLIPSQTYKKRHTIFKVNFPQFPYTYTLVCGLSVLVTYMR